jgi:hypothetical protein
MGDDHHSAMTYEPLNTLKSVADDVWIVDGPVIRFGMPWPKMPFPTRSASSSRMAAGMTKTARMNFAARFAGC